MSYPDVPVWVRISDAPSRHTPAGNKNAGEKREGSFPWTYKLLQWAAAAHEDGSTWQEIAEQLELRTGRSIGEAAVANRIRRFEEEEEGA